MSRQTCLAVTYHYVRDAAATPFPSLKVLSPDDFEAQLDWLTSQFTVVGADVLESAVIAGAPLPPNAAVLTFDDGVIDHYTTVMPALTRRGLQGLFFIVGGAVEDRPRLMNVHKAQFLLARMGADTLSADARARARARTREEAERWQGIYRLEGDVDRATKRFLNYELPFDETERILDELFREHIGDPAEFARAFYLSPALIREMRDAGMTFGFHTHSHPVMSRLDKASQKRELGSGVELIRRLTGQRDVSFCFPDGRPPTYNDATLELLSQLGYTMAFNTVRCRAELPGADRFQIPRFDTVDLPPFTMSVKAEDGELVVAAS